MITMLAIRKLLSSQQRMACDTTSFDPSGDHLAARFQTLELPARTTCTFEPSAFMT